MEPAPSRWLAGRLSCLLGSALALGAFFLPTFGGPDGSGWQAMLIGLGFSGQERDVFVLTFALLAVGYLLGVASLLLLTLWITFRPPDRIILTCCFAITVAALSIYVGILGLVISITLFLLVLIHFRDAFSFLFIMFHIGALLIPVGLTLVLLGIRRLRRANARLRSGKMKEPFLQTQPNLP